MRVVASDQWLVAGEGQSAGCARRRPGSRLLRARLSRRHRRSSYTLIELLITVSIIAIMASMVLFAMYAAQEQARVQKTRALIGRLNNIIRDRYESYRTRRLPMPELVDETFVDGNQNGVCDTSELSSLRDTNGNGIWDYSVTTRSKLRLDMLRDMMRMEMPDRWSDVVDQPPPLVQMLVQATPPIPPIDPPAMSLAYKARYNQIAEPYTDQDGDGAYDQGEPYTDTNGNGQRDPTYEYENAECLYMIVMEVVSQQGDARDVFKPDDVADTDGDGFPEFVDAWGTPIRFLRWAPGFISEIQNPVRGRIQQITPMTGPSQSVEIKAVGRTFSTSPSDYLWGTLAVLDQTNGVERIDTRMMGRITGYTYDPTTLIATFTLTTPSYTMQPVFNNMGIYPMQGDDFVVMRPDPFDPRGVFPIYPMGATSFPAGAADTSTPTFALYPLIYSAGPDKAYGIVSDTSTPFVYSAQALNPFFVPPQIGVVPFGLTMGSFSPPGTPESGFYVGCWNDNIHNHQLSTR